MPIDRAEVRRIARLAHLEHPRVQTKDGVWVDPPDLLMDDATLEKLAVELGKVLDHVRQLEEVNVEGVEPTSHGVRLPTVLRADEAKPGLGPDRVLAAAPARIGDAIAVPRIVE